MPKVAGAYQGSSKKKPSAKTFGKPPAWLTEIQSELAAAGGKPKFVPKATLAGAKAKPKFGPKPLVAGAARAGGAPAGAEEGTAQYQASERAGVPITPAGRRAPPPRGRAGTTGAQGSNLWDWLSQQVSGASEALRPAGEQVYGFMQGLIPGLERGAAQIGADILEGPQFEGLSEFFPNLQGGLEQFAESGQPLSQFMGGRRRGGGNAAPSFRGMRNTLPFDASQWEGLGPFANIDLGGGPITDAWSDYWLRRNAEAAADYYSPLPTDLGYQGFGDYGDGGGGGGGGFDYKPPDPQWWLNQLRWLIQ